MKTLFFTFWVISIPNFEISSIKCPKGRWQNRKTVKLGTLSQQEGGRSEMLKYPNPYFEPDILTFDLGLSLFGRIGRWRRAQLSLHREPSWRMPYPSREGPGSEEFKKLPWSWRIWLLIFWTKLLLNKWYERNQYVCLVSTIKTFVPTYRLNVFRTLHWNYLFQRNITSHIQNLG